MKRASQSDMRCSKRSPAAPVTSLKYVPLPTGAAAPRAETICSGAFFTGGSEAWRVGPGLHLVRLESLQRRLDVGDADQRMTVLLRVLFREQRDVARPRHHGLGELVLEDLPLGRIGRPEVPREVDLHVAQENRRRDVVVLAE